MPLHVTTPSPSEAFGAEGVGSTVWWFAAEASAGTGPDPLAEVSSVVVVDAVAEVPGATAIAISSSCPRGRPPGAKRPRPLDSRGYTTINVRSLVKVNKC